MVSFTHRDPTGIPQGPPGMPRGTLFGQFFLQGPHRDPPEPPGTSRGSLFVKFFAQGPHRERPGPPGTPRGRRFVCLFVCWFVCLFIAFCVKAQLLLLLALLLLLLLFYDLLADVVVVVGGGVCCLYLYLSSQNLCIPCAVVSLRLLLCSTSILDIRYGIERLLLSTGLVGSREA